MNESANTEADRFHAMHSYERARSLHSHRIWSSVAGSIPITAFTPGVATSFTTLVSSTDSVADRWKRFLSHVSPVGAASAFEKVRPGSTATKWWNVHARGSARATTTY